MTGKAGEWVRGVMFGREVRAGRETDAGFVGEVLGELNGMGVAVEWVTLVGVRVEEEAFAQMHSE